MLSYSIWFSLPSLWLDGGLESRCIGHVYGANGAVRTVHTTYAVALKTTTHPKTRCRRPYAATQHLMLLMMGVCTRNM
jgi:Ca2+/Na+ antiporter